jgi:uncharacterized protein (TIGR02217 family)
MSFNETRFETGYIIYLTDGGPRFSTDVVVVNSGAESRNQVWQYPLGHWDFGDRSMPDNELTEIINFFNAVAGMAIGFRFKDWGDFSVIASNGILGPVGVGTGLATYQLTKKYVSGSYSTNRVIRKPVSSTVSVFKNGTLVPVGANPGNVASIDYTTGTVTFVAPYPQTTDVITWSGEFDVPVRFDTDQLKYRFDAAHVETPGVLGTKYFYLAPLPLVEIRV